MSQPQSLSSYDLLQGAYDAVNDENYSLATKHFALLCQLDPHNAEYYLGYADALANMGDTAEACIQYQIAYSLAPDHAVINYEYGFFLHNTMHSPHQALPYLRHAVKVEPDAPCYLFNLGMCLQDCGMVEISHSVLNEQFSRSSEAGLALLGNDEITEAVIELNMALGCTGYDSNAVRETGLLRQIYETAAAKDNMQGIAAQCAGRFGELISTSFYQFDTDDELDVHSLNRDPLIITYDL